MTTNIPDNYRNGLPEPSQERELTILELVHMAREFWPIRNYFKFFEPRVKFTNHERYLLGHCPFHVHRGKALFIDTLENLWMCSECGISGDIVVWHSYRHHIGLRAAAEELVSYIGNINLELPD